MACLQQRPTGTRQAIVLYIDGGGDKTGVSAAWAVTIFDVSAEGWSLMGYIAAPVITEVADPQFIGASSTGSGSAEMSAEARAAIFVFARGFTVPIFVRYDSVTAAALAESTANPRVHVRLACVSAVLWAAV